MIKVYPDQRWPAFLRVMADTITVGWTIAWAYLGFLIYQTIMGLETIADGITNTGTTFNSWIASFRNAVPGGIPFVTSALQSIADAMKKVSGDQLVAAGHNIHQAILQTAIVLALLVALPPILLVLLAFVRIASITGRAEQARAVLAYRAVSTLSFRQLMSASADPVGDIAERRYDRLADAMIKRAGLDPTRLAPHELPELPPHRGG
jgi:hypothetical protein